MGPICKKRRPRYETGKIKHRIMGKCFWKLAPLRLETTAINLDPIQRLGCGRSYLATNILPSFVSFHLKPLSQNCDSFIIPNHPSHVMSHETPAWYSNTTECRFRSRCPLALLRFWASPGGSRMLRSQYWQSKTQRHG
jgi:hypothetical protein